MCDLQLEWVMAAAVVVLTAGIVATTTGCLSTETPETVPAEEEADRSDEIDEWGWGDEPRVEEDEMVVLVHGLGRTKMAMYLMGRTLEDAGYRVHNWGYSSTCCSVEELGGQLSEELAALEEPRPDRIHFVGHSLGNIIIRHALGEDPPAEPGRVVMLAPPNQGSHTADRYVDWFGWALEPLGDLVTEEGSTARSISPIGDREVGIIAGEYDGKVDVDETKLETQDDHEVVETFHTFIMNRSETQQLVLDFLAHGEF